MATITNRTISLPLGYLSSLGEELEQIARALSHVSKKLKKIPQVPTIRVTPKTDPDMFTEEFLEAVKKSRREIQKGNIIDYTEFRKTLDF